MISIQSKSTVQLLVLIPIIQFLLAGFLLSQTQQKDPYQIRLLSPSTLVDGKPFSLKAEIIQNDEKIAWETWDENGTIEIVNPDNQQKIPFKRVRFDTSHPNLQNSDLHFRNGIGSASLTLLPSTTELPDQILLRIRWNGIQQQKRIQVLKEPQYSKKQGYLPGTNIVWGPEQGTIHITDDLQIRSNQTLWIKPGTKIMIDSGPAGDGTSIIVQGKVKSLGTFQKPVYIFPSSGSQGMILPENCHENTWNPHSWNKIVHTGESPKTSVYQYTMITGGGNAPAMGHVRAPALLFKKHHSFEFIDSACMDMPGKCIMTKGSGTYQIKRSLFTRSGHGGEYEGIHNFQLSIEDSWFLRNGKAPRNCELAADHINVRNPGGTGKKKVERSIIAEGNDDGIDQQATSLTIRDTLIYDIKDKAISSEHTGTVKIDNSLIFDTHWGIPLEGTRVRGNHLTIDSNRPLEGPIETPRKLTEGSVLTNSIIWPSKLDTCGPGTIRNTILGNEAPPKCEEGNQALQPRFQNPEQYNYLLKSDAPIRSRETDLPVPGWKGFPGNSIVPREFTKYEISTIPSSDQHQPVIPDKQWFQTIASGDENRIQELIQKDVNIHRRNNQQQTALIVATEHGNLPIVQQLLNAGANVNARSKNGATALMVAAEQGHTQIAQALLEAGANINLQSEVGNTALFIAARNGNLNLTRSLIDAGADLDRSAKYGRTPLMIAGLLGHKKIVHTLIDAGANVNAKDQKDGIPPLLFISWEGHLDLVKHLLEAGANVQARDHRRRTALMVSAQQGNPKVTELLLQSGASVNAQSNRGWSPLLYGSLTKNFKSVKKLLAAGANVNTQARDGKTALHLAAFNGGTQLTKILIKHGAKINQQDHHGWTPLMNAALEGNKKVAEILKNAGANIKKTNQDGKTAVQIADENDHEALKQMLNGND